MLSSAILGAVLRSPTNPWAWLRVPPRVRQSALPVGGPDVQRPVDGDPRIDLVTFAQAQEAHDFHR